MKTLIMLSVLVFGIGSVQAEDPTGFVIKLMGCHVVFVISEQCVNELGPPETPEDEENLGVIRGAANIFQLAAYQKLVEVNRNPTFSMNYVDMLRNTLYKDITRGYPNYCLNTNFLRNRIPTFRNSIWNCPELLRSAVPLAERLTKGAESNQAPTEPAFGFVAPQNQPDESETVAAPAPASNIGSPSAGSYVFLGKTSSGISVYGNTAKLETENQNYHLPIMTKGATFQNYQDYYINCPANRALVKTLNTNTEERFDITPKYSVAVLLKQLYCGQ